MSIKRRLFGIISALILSLLVLPVMGLPYDSFTVLASSLLQYGEKATATPPPIQTILEVEDQDVSAGMVIVKRASVGIRSWILIHNQEGGQVGEIIGSAIVLFGETLDVVIPIDLGQASPVLYASAYADWGQKEVYDPELDTPTTDFVAFEAVLSSVSPDESSPTLIPTAVSPTPVSPDEPTPVPVEVAAPRMSTALLILVLCLGAGFAGVMAGLVVYFLMRSRGGTEPIHFMEGIKRMFQRDRNQGEE